MRDELITAVAVPSHTAVAVPLSASVVSKNNQNFINSSSLGVITCAQRICNMEGCDLKGMFKIT